MYTTHCIINKDIYAYFQYLTYPLNEKQNRYCVNLAQSQNCFFHADHEIPIKQEKNNIGKLHHEVTLTTSGIEYSIVL